MTEGRRKEKQKWNFSWFSPRFFRVVQGKSDSFPCRKCHEGKLFNYSKIPGSIYHRRVVVQKPQKTWEASLLKAWKSPPKMIMRKIWIFISFQCFISPFSSLMTIISVYFYNRIGVYFSSFEWTHQIVENEDTIEKLRGGTKRTPHAISYDRDVKRE